MDISSTIKFRDICGMFEKVKKATQVQKKEQILRRYYDSFCRHRESFRQQANISPDQIEDGSCSFYPVLRLLLPHADHTARPNYGLQITALGRLYTKVLQLARDSADAKNLQYRNPTTLKDYADVVYAVLLPRCQRNPSDWTLKQIHDMLDKIASEDITIKEQQLIQFTEIASAVEQKWIIRLLLKSMSLGIGEQRIFGLLHPNAKDIYQRCTDLSRVCNLLADNKLLTTLDVGGPQVNLNVVIEPFHQIRPMLCESFPGKIEELMQSNVLYLERKMDGERFQLHYANERFRFYSRNGTDYTHGFANTLQPELPALMMPGIQSMILDGEMMVWDIEQQRYRDKGENTDVKHLATNSGCQPCFVVYDLLYLNGQSWLDRTYVERTYKMLELLKEKPGVLLTMKGQKITSLDEFNRMFQELLDANAEGIVLKKQDSIYKPGQRIGGGWYKDKADYIKGLTTEFDLLIIGGFYNRKRTFIEAFLLGVLKRNIGDGDGRDEVFSVGRVANNTRQRTVLNQTLKQHWHDTSKEPPPLWYHYKSSSTEGTPDVWIEPRVSTILQIKAADLVSYGAFHTRKSLHFPRTEAVRDDKVWDECMSLQEFMQLCQGSVGIKKIHKRELRLDDFTTERKRQKLTPAARKQLGLTAYEKRYDVDKLELNSQLFDGFTFCILSGAPQRRYSKQQLQQLAACNGGKIVENPLPNDFNCICVAGDITYYVERLKQQEPRTNDIVSMDWLLRACEQQKIIIRPKDMIACTVGLQQQFAKSYDKSGDSYTDQISSIEEMQEILNDIALDEDTSVATDYNDDDELELLEMEAILLGTNISPNFFRNCRAYFYNNDTNSSSPSSSSTSSLPSSNEQREILLFMQRGGICIKDLTSDCERRRITHIFVNENTNDGNSIKLWQKDHNLSSKKLFKTQWIIDSHRQQRKLPIDEYQLWTSTDYN